MEAKETAGLPMTERVARDCSSGLLETTSNRLWSSAKMNTRQLLQKKKKEMRGRDKQGEKRWLGNKIEMQADQRKINKANLAEVERAHITKNLYYQIQYH